MALDRMATDTGIVALAGGGQAGAPQLRPQSITRVSTVATAADSVMLPRAVPGTRLIAINGTANSMNVFPSPGDTINALAADAALAVAAGKSIEFACPAAGAFYGNLSA